MNYRRNEDRLLWDDRLYYNELVDLRFSEGSVDLTTFVVTPPAVEPVTLAEAKLQLIMTFTDDDAYINTLIKSCRQSLEKFTGLSLVEKLITWHVNNSRGGGEFPYGPVRAIASFKDSEDTVLTSPDGYELSGLDFKTIKSPHSELLKVTYIAGFTSANFPADLKLELMKMITWEYEHRGDEKDVQYKFTNKAWAHRRVSIIL